MAFTRFTSTDPADIAGLLNRLGDELTAETTAAGGTAAWAGVSGKPATYPPSAHTHGWTAIADKPATYPPSAHGHTWGDVSGKPTTYPPAAHSHAVSDVTGLAARLGTLEQDTGPRNLGSLVPELTAGHWTVRRIGNLVYSNIYDAALTATAGTFWQRSGFLPVGFQPLASSQYVHFACAQRTTGFANGPFRVDRYGGVTIYDVTGKTVAVTAVWVTADPFPAVFPGDPA